MSALPRGWAEATVGEIGRYINGRGFKKAEWGDSGRPIIRIQNLTGSGTSFNYYDGPLEPRYVVPTGSLLVSWAATLGVYRWTGTEGALNQHIFRVESRIDEEFHRYLLEQALDVMRQDTHGSGMVHITKGRFDSTPVPVPPLAEQRGIVAAIEEAFSKLDAGEVGLHGVRQRLRRLRGSVLADAVTPTEHDQWTPSQVGDLLMRIETGKSFATEGRPARDGEDGVIKVSAMTWGEFRPSENKALPRGTAVEPRWRVGAGDLLFSRANTSAYVGACVSVDRDYPSLVLSDKSLRLVPRSDVDKRWLLIALRARPARSQIEVLATGTKESMRNISQAKLRSVSLALPSFEEQQRIVAEVERQFSFIEAGERAVDAALVKAAALRRSVLKAAFEGKLVEQDPSDEPASVLLERIRAERAATSG